MVNNIEFVAEFTTNHMGNLNILLEMVKHAANSGANWIKMQKKDVESFYSQDKLNSLYQSPYGHTYRDYRKIFEFEKEDFDRFDRECKKHNIKWFSTVQDIISLEWMINYDLDMYKISSSVARNEDMINEIARQVSHNKPIVMSVAGLTLSEIEKRLNLLQNFKVYVLHCVAEYPTQIHNQKLGNITALRKNFESSNITIGYSGHEEGFIPTLAAIDLGAKMIERHFCLSKHSFVHHIECSLIPEEFKAMIDTVKNNEGNLADIYTKFLPPVALDENFQMTEMEKDFLLDQKYGKKYLHGKSGSSFIK